MFELTLAGVAAEVRANAIQGLPEALRSIAQDIAERGLRAAHFQGRLSGEMSQMVLAVANESRLRYDEATRFPGYDRLPFTLQLWLEFA